jgi:predicted Zn-dependent peptidase
MKLKLFFLASLFLIVEATIAQTKPGGNTKPVGDVKKSLDYEFVPNDPLKTRIYTLQNGLKVYLSVYKNAPRIQTYIAVKAGSKNDPAYATGLAHYLEHMVFKGTDKFGSKNWPRESAEIKKIEKLYEVYRGTKDDAKRKVIYHQIDSISGVASTFAIANEYDKMMASLGADGTNAYTSFDETVYVNDIPSNQVNNFLKVEAERFSTLVLRLFHTELEAVYEEKNRNLDSDQSKTFEALFAALFKKHTYGTQTTIGTIDHLKNPSMVEIHKYFDKYYVPNNMAVVMSGDFDPDVVIKQVEATFGKLKSKPVEPFRYDKEDPITKKIKVDVVGPDPESLFLGWRFDGFGSKDDDMITLLSSVLSNGNAGLLDLNLNQAQKVLSAGAFVEQAKDYSLFAIAAEPKEGQALEEVEKLLMDQLELVKKGEFPDWLLSAVITEMKLQKTKELEVNKSRADEMLHAFVNGSKWEDRVATMERISKITKQELVDFAKKNFTSENYVAIYKRTGEDTTVQKVDKPEITPVEVNRDDSSPFAKAIEKSAPAPIAPVFVDYKKDVNVSKLKSEIPLLYNQNTENKLFELYYNFDMGKNVDKTLPIAIEYIPYISTKDMSASAIKEELYKLGCSFDVFCDNENTWVRLVGLNDNLEKGVHLLEKILSEPQVEAPILANLISDMIKGRNDRKLQKDAILNGAMMNYALYGPQNPFTNVLSDAEMNSLTVEDIAKKIKTLLSFEHKVLYYGPSSVAEVQTLLNTEHIVPTTLNKVPEIKKYDIKELDNTIYTTDYDMKQVEILMLSNGPLYDPALVPPTWMYNSYFGGGMSSVVFQDLRESKALAYSTYSRFNVPNKKYKKTFNLSYIGSQADKLNDAIKGLKALLENIPQANNTFASSKEMLLQELRTQRVTRSQILFNYLQAESLGHDHDIRKDLYEKIQTYTFADVKKFHDTYIKGKPTTMLLVGKNSSLDKKILEKYGKIKEVTLKEVFGY